MQGRSEPPEDRMATGEIRAQERRSAMPKLILGLALAILFVIFVVQNSQPVNVQFLWLDGRAPLVWIFLICAAIGAVVLALFQRPSRRTMRRYIEELERQREEWRGRR
jgi:uncharacterized integral membrane protein